MSSILNALKKVEADGAIDGLRRPPAPHPLKVLLSPRSDANRSSRRYVPYAVAAIIILSAGAAGYYKWFGAGDPSKTEKVVQEVRSRLPSDSIAPQPTQPEAAPPTASAQRPARAQSKAPPPVQAPPPSSRIRPSEGGGPSSETRVPAVARSATSQDRAGAGRSAAGRSPEDALSLLDESKLKVMAIAWFEDPTRRLAVVNGHIVKEGESVEGYSVTRIRKDDIIVSDGSRSYRVELNLKNKSG